MIDSIRDLFSLVNLSSPANCVYAGLSICIITVGIFDC